MKKYNKIKKLRVVQAVRKINKNHDRILFKIAVTIFSLICTFIVICTILEMQWLDPNYELEPVLVWICKQPFIGAFFLPFLILILLICQFILVVSKPVTIDSVASNLLTLREYNDITKKGYETMTQILEEEKKLLIERRRIEAAEMLKMMAQKEQLKVLSFKEEEVKKM